MENEDKIKLGAYVRSGDNKGRVYNKHQTFHFSNEDDWWFNQLEIVQGLTDSQRKWLKDRAWVSILCHDEGSIMSPVSQVEMIPEFELKNKWASFYF